MTRERPHYLDRITHDPKIMVGKPIVRGTRIPVELVLEQLSYNLDLDELFAAYPRLTIEDVKACLAYAHAAVEAKRKRAARKESVSAAQGRATGPVPDYHPQQRAGQAHTLDSLGTARRLGVGAVV
jgi:uncharacterized protein (DUF433 family)